ncbi:hypothetical protein SAMN07250955_10654 [Arboricoccus pini]|uniref:Uncharacterized protein n=1 Tax=Arboricoccus pini TaxID=1963835 RepID=A0A212R6T9_9PROT|nr:hypothetical protein [Arboricoccus pini]SNB67798.1 hypothetical protein SAMN07250955_10654 [Arboricoccus pini]
MTQQLIDITLSAQRFHSRRDPSQAVYTKDGRFLLEGSTPLASVSRLFLAQSADPQARLRVTYPDGRVSVTPGTIQSLAQWAYEGGDKQPLHRVPYQAYDAAALERAA